MPSTTSSACSPLVTKSSRPAAGTIDRLIDQFPPDRQEQVRAMLSESLRGVISQTLCKKIGGGRVAAREVLLTIPSIANLIREGKTFQIASVIQTSKRLGMIHLLTFPRREASGRRQRSHIRV